jgi:hypothetical protein
MPPHSTTGGVPSPEPALSNDRSPRNGRNRDYKKSNANAASKRESVPKTNAAGRLACDICRESKIIQIHYIDYK